MLTTKTTARRRRRNPWTTGLAALSFLALPLLLAASAEAQRGGHGGGRGGYSGGHRGSGQHGGYKGHHGGHRGHYGYSGHYGGTRGYGGYRGYGRHYGGTKGYGHGGHRGYAGSYGYRGGYGYGTHYGHGYGNYSSRGHGSYFGYRPGYYGGYAYYRPRVYSQPYVVYGSPAYYDADTSAYLDYDLSQDPAQRFRVPEAEPPAGEVYAEPGGPLDARLEPARATLAIEPGDAAVYLDGRFLGLAAELPEALLIEPGEHLLEVARPGFATHEVDLSLEPGEEIEVDARLAPVG